MSDHEYPIGYDDPDLAERMQARAMEAHLESVAHMVSGAPLSRRRAAVRLLAGIVKLLVYAFALLVGTVTLAHVVWRIIEWAWTLA